MSIITRNWGSSDWERKEFTQKDGHTTISVGEAFEKKAVSFGVSIHKPSKEVYPQKSDRLAVATNLAYTAMYIPAKAFTAAGNVVVGGANVSKAAFDSVKNLNNSQFSKKNAFSPALTNVKHALIDGTVAFLGYSAYKGNLDLYFGSFGTVYGDHNIALYAVAAAASAAALYGLWNPQGFQRGVHHYAGRIDVAPLTDGEVHKASYLKRAVAVLDGRYSLARLLRMHYMGKSDSQKFEEVQSKKIS